MNKVWKITALGVFILLILTGTTLGIRFKKQEQLRFAARLGSGFNLGNALDTTGVWKINPDVLEDEYETFWGNPIVDETQFAAIRKAGFTSVRIPITWEEHMDEQGIIADTWLERVKDVVDLALAQKLYVIIDTHHEEWLDLDLSHENEIQARYQTVWTQIAEKFLDYDEHLLFEGMNEPRLRGSEHEWDAGTLKLRAMVNRLNQTFVEAVRKTGGKNKTRYLLISAYATNVESDALADLEVPGGNIIVSAHMYWPYLFCQNEEGTSEWDAGNAEDTQQIKKAFNELHTRFIDNGIPVALTEFGCKDKGNDDVRAAWVAYYKEQAGDIPCFWWDNGSDYQLLDRENGKWMHPEILRELVR